MQSLVWRVWVPNLWDITLKSQTLANLDRNMWGYWGGIVCFFDRSNVQ